MITPKRHTLSFVFTVLCFKKSLLILFKNLNLKSEVKASSGLGLSALRFTQELVKCAIPNNHTLLPKMAWNFF